MKLLLVGIMLLSGAMFSFLANAENVISAPASNIADIFSIEGMSLNDGQKWEMDNHTRHAFEKMAKSFLNIDIYSLKPGALKMYGAVLQSGTNDLIKGCTMEGSSHDQLHIFLMAYIPEVEALAKTGSLEKAEKVQLYLRDYSVYFE